ncbi:hypothetical protein C8R44DRAFT_869172 [Mycena epipterygia]|nr:hypothetical protein C8R44DRAFT_869172 [Mycena epipterygia]
MPAAHPSEPHLRLHPILNSYCATAHLLACEYPWDLGYPSTVKLDALLNAGIRTVVDLTEERELLISPAISINIPFLPLDAISVNVRVRDNEPESKEGPWIRDEERQTVTEKE